ncbi:hypothetical protein [Spartinivicinus poritis]|uniref:Uncharacterized protein n=1 Tax=Spartinivicinus poritis TaxID=2994640 RepID=A0ABT5UAT8_9GAMM|nr:hypothetical protein [Spartinivicinus sp. A2-2]MDE1462657.1 hypothetical protein [Spartinivicinus sp. A2-2]
MGFQSLCGLLLATVLAIPLYDFRIPPNKLMAGQNPIDIFKKMLQLKLSPQTVPKA